MIGLGLDEEKQNRWLNLSANVSQFSIRKYYYKTWPGSDMYEADFRYQTTTHCMDMMIVVMMMLVVVVIVGGSETDYSLSSALPLQPWRPSCHTLWSQENAWSTQILSEVQENIHTSNPRPSSRKVQIYILTTDHQNLKTREVCNQDILADEKPLKAWVDVVFAPNEMWY